MTLTIHTVFKKMILLSALTAVPLAYTLLGYSAQPLTAILASQDGTGRYLVSYSNENGKETLSRLAGTATHSHMINLDYLSMVAITLTPAQKSELSRQQGISHIEPSVKYTNAIQSNSVQSVSVTKGEQASWGYQTVDAEIGFQKQYTGKNVKVAILDTGISPHSDLKIASGISTVDYTSEYTDDNGHGTFVAGVIGALNNGKGLIGQAPDAQLYAVKILDKQGSGTTEDLAEGLNWAIQQNVDIINMSISFPQASPAVEQMLQSAHGKGILMIASAGNHGTADAAADTVEYPARSPEVMGILTVDSQLERADFSASGSEADVAAPGVSIISTANNGKYELRDGTSVSAPFVSGLAAVLKEAYPNSTNEQIRQAISSTAVDLGVPGKDNLYGYGMISYQHLFDSTSPLGK
ncbi:S8 family peptidase [Paenibacillus bovis]|uniref:Peptidase S8/S53 domain-containing protein n=1 Tax=Paenibacillus bovis TaxID=1616788 RepID=A0A172ZH84_9BACL|nr:S8 family peptidase [Paenibacillus bovis]ANF96996.1 hypothetical protein AR543_13935 [Paenibacillus bovis]